MGSLRRAIRALPCAMVVLLGLGLCQASHADNCSGYIAEFNNSYDQSLELVQANLMNSFNSYDIMTSNDYPNYNGQMGECHGAWLVTSDGKSSGTGSCAFSDKDGDTEYVQWESSTEGGTWKHVGGTGKWVGKHNSGWTKLLARDHKRTLLQWGGTCQ